MANKRDLKKMIKYTCSDIAGECIFAKIAGRGSMPAFGDHGYGRSRGGSGLWL